MTKGSLVRTEFIPSYSLGSIILGSWDRNMEAGADEEAMEECCLLGSSVVYSSCFLIVPRTTCPGTYNKYIYIYAHIHAYVNICTETKEDRIMPSPLALGHTDSNEFLTEIGFIFKGTNI